MRATLLKKDSKFMKKVTLEQVLCCEVCEISKNTFFTEHLRTTPAEWRNRYLCSPINIFLNNFLWSKNWKASWEFHITVILIWTKTEEKWIDRCAGVGLGFSHTKVDISWPLCKKLKFFDLKLIHEIKQKIITHFAKIQK